MGKSSEVGWCEKRSEFSAEVIKVGRRWWLVAEFCNDRQEVMKGANGIEWRIGRVAQEAARGGQQESVFDQRERELLLVELKGETAIIAGMTIGGIG